MLICPSSVNSFTKTKSFAKFHRHKAVRPHAKQHAFKIGGHGCELLEVANGGFGTTCPRASSGRLFTLHTYDDISTNIDRVDILLV